MCVYQDCIEFVAVLVITSYSTNLCFCLWNIFLFSQLYKDENIGFFSIELQPFSSISDELVKLDFGQVYSRNTWLK